MAIEITLVGPLISCLDESNNAPDRSHDDGGIEPHLDWQVEDKRVRHRLRNRDGGHG